MTPNFGYQDEDVEKLAEHTGALVVSDMGTGKTFIGVKRDIRIRQKYKGATLVVAPLSVLSAWADVYQLLYPELKVVVCNNKARDSSWKLFVESDAEVFVVHWDALRLMPQLADYRWLHIIADECHRMQSRNAQQTKALKKIRSDYKTGMSGTPVTNTPDKLWSVLNWLYPKDYKSYWKFYRKYVDFTVVPPQNYHVINGPKNEKDLLKQIRPFFVRHRKKHKCCPNHPNGVNPWLPDKYYPPTPIYVDLSPKQKKVYNAMKKDMLAWIGKNEDTPLAAPVVIAQFTRLSQFACAYAEIDAAGDVKLSEPSSKLDALFQILNDNPDEQIVVFSQFKQLIDLLEKRLVDKQISYVKLTGDTPGKLRGSLVDRFQKGEARLFISTIAAGGVGITLTAASTVVFLDRSWSPALNEQAEDRLHRIGQDNPVQVLDIAARGTIDLGRFTKLELKRSWLRKILGDSA